MSITMRQLRYLVAVVERKSFRKAAATLNVSQPAMTAQMQLMEQLLGGLVLTRTRRGATPTPLGQQIADRARSVLHEVEGIMALGRAAADRPLKLGLIPTVAPYLGPEIMDLGGDLTSAGFETIEACTADLIAAVRVGHLDAALIALPADPVTIGRDLERASAFSEPFYVLLASGDPLARRSTVTVADLKEHPLLLLDKGHCLTDQTLAFCANDQARAPVRSSSLSMLVRLVARGRGITLMPAIALGLECRSGDGTAAVPFDDPTLGRTLALVWRKGTVGERCWRRLAHALAALAPAERTAPTFPGLPLAAE